MRGPWWVVERLTLREPNACSAIVTTNVVSATRRWASSVQPRSAAHMESHVESVAIAVPVGRRSAAIERATAAESVMSGSSELQSRRIDSA